uniref:Uncharacterized protein n=1 Tax=Plectus sambesii TaxID=2011161 RepID=A0A914VLC7_9BILA
MTAMAPTRAISCRAAHRTGSAAIELRVLRTDQAKRYLAGGNSGSRQARATVGCPPSVPHPRFSNCVPMGSDRGLACDLPPPPPGRRICTASPSISKDERVSVINAPSAKRRIECRRRRSFEKESSRADVASKRWGKLVQSAGQTGV